MDSEQQAGLDWDIADVIQLLANHLPEELRSQALERARSLVTLGAKVAGLVGVAEGMSPPLRDSVRDEALQTARSIDKPWYRLRALAEVMGVSDVSQQKDILGEMLSIVPEVPGEWNRRRALFMVSNHLTSELAHKAVLMARSFEAENIRVESLARLSRYLSDSEKLELLDKMPALYEDETQESLSSSLINLAGNLPAGTKSKVLQHTDHVTLPGLRIDLLMNLIEQLPDQKEKFIDELPRLLLDNKGEADYFWSLFSAAGVVPEPERQNIIQEALGVARGMEGFLKVQQLAPITNYLNDDEKKSVLDEAIETARSVENPVFRAKSFGFMMSNLPDDIRSSIAVEAWMAIL